MREPDARGRKVALVPDFLINPEMPEYAKLKKPPLAVLKILDKHGFGILQLPSHLLPARAAKGQLAFIMDQVEEYIKRGYEVVLLRVEGLRQGGAWLQAVETEARRRGLPKLKGVKVPLPPKATSQESALRDFESRLTASIKAA